MLDIIACAIEDFERFSASNSKVSPMKAYFLGMKYVYKNMDYNNIEFQDCILEINKLLKECDNIIENDSIEFDSKDIKKCPFCGNEQLEFLGPSAKEINGKPILRFKLECTHCHASVAHTISLDQIKLSAMNEAKQQLFLKWNSRKEA